MNGHNLFSATEMVQDAEIFTDNLREATERLMEAIEAERIAANRLRDAEQDYDSAEAEGLFTAIMQAQAKEGPLAGIASTSKAYSIALDNLRVEIRTRALPHVWENVVKARAAHDEATISLKRAEAEMSYLKKAADLKTAVLNFLAR